MPMKFERHTIFCADMDASLVLYRDLLGLVVVEEKVIEGAAAGGLLQLPPCRMRIALLAAEPQGDTILGLFQIGGVDIEALAPPHGRPATGQTALVLSTDQFDALQARLTAAGAKFLTPPVTYPKTHASERSPAGLYREMIFYDPDAVLVSIMQIDPLPEEIKP